jgi:biopolymer transport protein ExbD
LVFLLANSSAEEQDFVIAKNCALPNSTSNLGFTKAVQVKLSRKELLIEDTFVAKVSSNKLVGVDIDGYKIVPLYNMLQRYRSMNKETDKKTVVFQADKKFPFEILHQVMRTAAMAGYPNFRFAIQKK